jgi:hypothetical protein
VAGAGWAVLVSSAWSSSHPRTDEPCTDHAAAASVERLGLARHGWQALVQRSRSARRHHGVRVRPVTSSGEPAVERQREHDR